MTKKKKPYRTNLADIYSRPSAADVTLYKMVSDYEKAKRYLKRKFRTVKGMATGKTTRTKAIEKSVPMEDMPSKKYKRSSRKNK